VTAPGVLVTALTTPEVPAADSPPSSGQVEEAGCGNASGAVACSQSMKLFVVPDESERWTGVTARSGRSTPGLSATMAGSFQRVISPVKSFAMLSEDRFSESMPSRLKATAMAEM